MEPPNPHENITSFPTADSEQVRVARSDRIRSFPVDAHPVFVVDDTFFRARTPKATHWSIAWSDLMMTMFVLFLTLFVYQLAHREFLSEESPEVVAGTTMPIPDSSSAGVPFYPISPSISNNRVKRLKKLESIVIKDNEIDAIFEGTIEPTVEQLPEEETVKEEPAPLAVEDAQPVAQEAGEQPGEMVPAQVAVPEEDKGEETIITRMYDLSKVTLETEKLEKFASIELVPDKTMRIILTGDLLFDSGQAELTRQAKKSLLKLLPIIKQTPYMINVIGHTDSIPMHSEKFSSNWELSTARASQVARFLIDEGRIQARQVVVSGFSYYRPVKPNTTAANRKANRRVEIILSKEPPPPQSATEANIQ